MATWLIGGIIFLYAAWVLRKRIREIRAGKYCSGCCDGCPSKCKGCAEE